MKVQSLVQEYPWRRSWQPTPVFMPEEFHGQRSWEGYIAQSRTQLKQLSMYTHTHTHTRTHAHTQKQTGPTESTYFIPTRKYS